MKDYGSKENKTLEKAIKNYKKVRILKESGVYRSKVEIARLRGSVRILFLPNYAIQSEHICVYKPHIKTGIFSGNPKLYFSRRLS